MSLPKKVAVGQRHNFSVRQEYLGNFKLGHVDFDNEEIVINSQQPRVGKHHTLLHELLHVACENMIAAGILKCHPSENFITHLAGALYFQVWRKADYGME